MGFDLNISNDTTIFDKSISNQSGSVFVEPGGHLTIEKTKMVFGVGGFGITVADGASLSVVDSNITLQTGIVEINEGASAMFDGTVITVTGTSFGAFPIGLNGGSLTLNRSTIQTAAGGGGFDISSTSNNASLTILNSVLNGGSNTYDFDGSIKLWGDYENLVMKDSVMENCPDGITIGGPHSTAIVVNDSFKGILNPLSGSQGLAKFVFTGNLLDVGFVGVIGAADLTVANNTVSGSMGVGLAANCGGGGGGCKIAHPIVGNKIMNVPLNFGFLINVNNTLVANNTVINAKDGINVQGNNDTVNSNMVINASSGIEVYGAGDKVFNNSFTPSETTKTTTATTTTSSSTTKTTTSSTSTTTSLSTSTTTTTTTNASSTPTLASTSSSSTLRTSSSSSTTTSSRVTTSSQAATTLELALVGVVAVVLVVLGAILFRRRHS
jgi:hypothetical protein